MTTDEVAGYLGVNKKTLDRMRGRGDGPRYLRLTKKIIRYSRADVEEFLNSRKRANTAQA
jgi:predicted DNA-binding transcriptional regulator AlpA